MQELDLSMLSGLRRNKLAAFYEIEDRMARISQLIGALRLDICDTIDPNRKNCTPYEGRMGSVADYLEKARKNVWNALALHDDAIADYIAEGYPGLDQNN